MGNTKFAQCTYHGKTLDVICVALQGGEIPINVVQHADEAFKELVPYIKNTHQVLYIRDIPELATDQKYPGGHCYNEHEAMIALVGWGDDMQQIAATIHHELHHLARWQNQGYGSTLGGAILSEGIATYIEELRSGWLSPWATASYDAAALDAAKKSWDDENYAHAEWFFSGSHGKWVGYGLGYALAAKLFSDGFDLERSLSISPDEARSILEKL